MMTPRQLNPARELEFALGRFMSPINARGVMKLAARKAGVSEQQVRSGELPEAFVDSVRASIVLYIQDAGSLTELRKAIEKFSSKTKSVRPLTSSRLDIKFESDVVRARAEARRLATELGFQHTDQIKIMTVVSELARNIERYAGEGILWLNPHLGVQKSLEVIAEDHGPGIKNLEEVLSGSYRSKTGMGRGLIGCRNLADDFEIQSAPSRGTRVRFVKILHYS